MRRCRVIEARLSVHILVSSRRRQNEIISPGESAIVADHNGTFIDVSFTFALMTTGAFSRNIGKLFSELKLVTDNLLSIYDTFIFGISLTIPKLHIPKCEHHFNLPTNFLLFHTCYCLQHTNLFQSYITFQTCVNPECI